jgi:hypothetical protein
VLPQIKGAQQNQNMLEIGEDMLNRSYQRGLSFADEEEEAKFKN